MSQPKPSRFQREMLDIAEPLGYRVIRRTGHEGLLVEHPTTGVRVNIYCSPRWRAGRTIPQLLRKGAVAQPETA